MIKYYNTEVVFEEIPDEVTLAFNITNCQHNCPGCHSPYLRENIGNELNFKVIDELIEKLAEFGEKVIFLGDGVPVFKKVIDEKLQVSHFYAPSQCNRQRAAAVAEAAKKYIDKGAIETASEHRPDYLRLSQAEREAKEKNGAQD